MLLKTLLHRSRLVIQHKTIQINHRSFTSQVKLSIVSFMSGYVWCLYSISNIQHKTCKKNNNQKKKNKASPSQRYHVLVKSFTLKHDPNQELVVKKLDELYEKLQHYDPPKLPNEPDTESIASLGTFDIPSSSNNTSTSSSSGGGRSGLFGRFFGGNDKKDTKSPISSSSSSSSPFPSSHPAQVKTNDIE